MSMLGSTPCTIKKVWTTTASLLLFGRSCEHEHNSDEVLDLIKMCIPTDDDIPWLIKNQKDDLGRLKMLKFAKMDDGTEATI